MPVISVEKLLHQPAPQAKPSELVKPNGYEHFLSKGAKDAATFHSAIMIVGRSSIGKFSRAIFDYIP